MSTILPSQFVALTTACLIVGCTSEASEDPATPAADTMGVGPAESEPAPAPSGDAALDAIRQFIASRRIDKSRSGWKSRLPKPPMQTFESGKSYYWNLETSEGAIRIKLMPDVAPMHVTSTIYLTELGFYDDLTFHRVMAGFMAQGGCPLGSGTGNPGYSYGGEFDPRVRHDRPGLVSMANAYPRPDTDGSQFFITFAPTRGLDDRHTIFGEVVEGLDTTVRKLEAAADPMAMNGVPPKKTLTINKATISVE